MADNPFYNFVMQTGGLNPTKPKPRSVAKPTPPSQPNPQMTMDPAMFKLMQEAFQSQNALAQQQQLAEMNGIQRARMQDQQRQDAFWAKPMNTSETDAYTKWKQQGGLLGQLERQGVLPPTQKQQVQALQQPQHVQPTQQPNPVTSGYLGGLTPGDKFLNDLKAYGTALNSAKPQVQQSLHNRDNSPGAIAAQEIFGSLVNNSNQPPPSPSTAPPQENQTFGPEYQMNGAEIASFQNMLHPTNVVPPPPTFVSSMNYLQPAPPLPIPAATPAGMGYLGGLMGGKNATPTLPPTLLNPVAPVGGQPQQDPYTTYGAARFAPDNVYANEQGPAYSPDQSNAIDQATNDQQLMDWTWFGNNLPQVPIPPQQNQPMPPAKRNIGVREIPAGVWPFPAPVPQLPRTGIQQLMDSIFLPVATPPLPAKGLQRNIPIQNSSVWSGLNL